MKFFLTSSGLTNRLLTKTFCDLLPRPAAECRIAFIPTAANLSDETDWLDDDIKNMMNSGIGHVDHVDIAVAPKSEWLPKLQEADVLWFNGGYTSYLLDWIRKSGLIEELNELLSSRLYVGSSAGSMVAGPSIESNSVIYPEEDDYKIDDISGLNFVPFAIIPHLNSDFFSKAKPEFIEEFSKSVNYPVYALDDNSAVLSINGSVSLISEGVTWGI